MSVLGRLAGLFGLASFNEVVFDAARNCRQDVEPLRAAVAAHLDLLDAPNPNENDRTPLHAAAGYGSAEAVQLLLDSGSQSLDTRDNNGRTPMHLASIVGKVAVVEALLRAGSRSIDKPDKSGRTPLHYAAMYGKVEAVETLLRAGSRSLDTLDNDGKTPLHHAVDMWGKVEAVEALLRAGSQSLNKPDKSGRTPLHISASRGDVLILQALLQAGADPTIGITDQDRLQFDLATRQLLADRSQPSSSSAARSSASPS